MGVMKGQRFDEGDVFVDHPFEQVMFRWDHRARRTFRKFYGGEEQGPVPHDNRLFNDALRFGDEITAAEYHAGR
jgi:hypothetical protein